MDLREFLFRKNMTKRELSKIIDCNYQTVCKWIRGHSFPSLPMAKRLIEFSNGAINLEDLYGKKVGLEERLGDTWTN